MELESALFCFYWIKIGRKMGSLHKLWALLKIGPPQWEFCHTWLLCLSSAGLWTGPAMYFCLYRLFCLVVLWISIWFSLSLLYWKILTTFGFGTQQSKRTYSKQSLGTNLIALVNKQRGFISNDSCLLWKNTAKYLSGKIWCVFCQTIWFMSLSIFKCVENVHIVLLKLLPLR